MARSCVKNVMGLIPHVDLTDGAFRMVSIDDSGILKQQETHIPLSLLSIPHDLESPYEVESIVSATRFFLSGGPR